MAMSRRPDYRRRIKPGRIFEWPENVGTPEEVASRVTYAGSALHKTYQSPAGPPAYRADKAKCDEYPRAAWPQLEEALRNAIRAEMVDVFRGEFPGRAWVWINNVLHEARLTNQDVGDYHGFPLNDPRNYPAPIDRIRGAPRVTIPAV